ncbi:hypothetical protein P153DRAFT_342487 [Dothidotthia symphoricarpi CBS 119687]|uniref:Ubiquitin-like domain-containing protein n=1 Tax=Dothidotthia symphoricarpi CBS 119687 TaxID=1392245 RepID=A0A6A6A9V8_9PLEO|nr:uncharacterized protein P153DRAFT_342487 [Dothidotthia symphoricarpi CBS 119687]KAF2128600.1 hypothetical protein P153DRAFT_342487 [Dothidotthia symphoricarpi CBS 119687]
MSELTFCRSFLSALDARPIKLSSDHIADARKYPAQGAYTLPRLPPPHPTRPSPKSTSTSSDASTSSLSITLKPLKPNTPTVPLPAVDAAKTSIFDLKTHYATSTSIPASKIKILYKKKPVQDSKTVAEVVGGDAAGDVEFGVMVMGGAVAAGTSGGGGTPVQSPPASVPTESEKGLASGGAAAVGPSGKELVATDEFWGDLQNFVLQRIKDEAESERLVGVFKAAWEESK